MKTLLFFICRTGERERAQARSPYVGVSEMLNGHRGIVFGKSAGKALVTVSAGSAENRITKSIDVTVSGIQLSEKLAAGIEVLENSTVTM